MTGPLEYPTADEINAIHERIAASHDGTEPGVRTPAAIGSALTHISEGYVDQTPESIHQKAAHLMRLIVADHPYVDGNKRTALAAAAYLYHLNGYGLNIDNRIRDHLRSFATDAEAADMDTLVHYLRNQATRKP